MFSRVCPTGGKTRVAFEGGGEEWEVYLASIVQASTVVGLEHGNGFMKQPRQFQLQALLSTLKAVFVYDIKRYDIFNESIGYGLFT